MFSAFRSDAVGQAAELAYRRIVDQARQPAFFIAYGVPDTLDGRFEMICLHAFLYLHRLKVEGERGAPLGQRFFDTMFADFDRSLREMGTGDLSVGREIRRMAEAFYGRIAAYDQGLAAEPEALQAALARNLLGTVAASPDRLTAMADYVRREAARLARQPAAELLAGEVCFGLSPPASTPEP